jgi:TfoX/Sxy family transcriptional regulator of competence genes
VKPETEAHMAYDEKLAERVREVLRGRAGFEERKMFGGLAFLHGGRMFCGIVKGDLMVRTGPERYEDALQHAHVRPMDFTGRPMTGMIYVAAPGLRGEALHRWVERGLEGLETAAAPVARARRTRPRTHR